MLSRTLLSLALVGSLTAGGTNALETEMHHAKGEFEVEVTPRDLDGPAEDPSLSRLTLVKKLTGELVATGHGQMLAAGGPEQSEGAYVALERITGTLNGVEGSFVLMHRGTMDASGYHMEVTVVPGSGTGGLEGLSGTFQIILEGGKHLYEFEYQLP